MAAETPWEEALARDGIVVHRRAAAGSPLHEVCGRGVVEAKLARVLAVLRDVAHEPEWIPKCSDASILEHRGGSVHIAYHRTSLPWPVADRDVVVRSEMTVDPDRRVVRIVTISTKDARLPPRQGVVRVPAMRAHWLLAPSEDGRATHVEYQAFAEPGGWVPSFLARWVSTELPYDTIVALRAQVKHRRYDHLARVLAASPELAPILVPAR